MSGEATTASWDGGWEATRRHQSRLWAQATPAARLAWLEEAIRLAHAAGALPRPPGTSLTESPTGTQSEPCRDDLEAS